MYVLSILIICIISSAAVVRASYEYSINVGTVLFSPSDLRNSHWSMNEVSLLKARRHFQGLLPPPNFIDTTNEDYVNTLLNYFKDAYKTIKREATSPISDSLMTTALSDALGGYLKLWVLPISKLAFYGGSVSQENIMKLYEFHNEIKRFLETDGTGWRSPNKNLLNSITVSVAPPKHITRSMKNPCEHLSYYEKIGDSLSIPTPYINWGDHDSTMFIPLKNQSLIPLSSPDHTNVLFKYYDAAKNCIDSNRNSEQSAFDDRFQTWLDRDVVPHLTDDHVYLPLGSVLSLVNKSREICDKTLHMFDPTIKTVYTHYVIGGIPIDLTSKKFWIVAIILVLEILWCIPALLYLLCVKKKKKRDSTTNIYTLLEASKNKSNTDYDDNRDRESNENNRNRKKYKNNKGFKIENRPRSGNVELEAQFQPSSSKGSMGTDTHSYFGSNNCSAVSVIHEVMPTPPLKSSLKKRSHHTPPPPPVQEPVIVIPTKSSKSRISIHKSDRRPKRNISESRSHPLRASVCTDSYTVDNTNIDRGSSLKQTPEPVEIMLSTTQINSSINLNDETPSNDMSMQSCATGELAANCPCLTCLEAEVGSVTTVVNRESQIKGTCSDKNVEINMEMLKPYVEKPKSVKKMKHVGLRLESGRPYLEIKIDKPQTEISVGIGGTFDPLSAIKRSRIPKRMPKTVTQSATTARATTASQMATCAPQKDPDKPKSLIPQPVKRPTDDIIIKSSNSKQTRKENKLNITL